MFRFGSDNVVAAYGSINGADSPERVVFVPQMPDEVWAASVARVRRLCRKGYVLSDVPRIQADIIVATTAQLLRGEACANAYYTYPARPMPVAGFNAGGGGGGDDDSGGGGGGGGGGDDAMDEDDDDDLGGGGGGKESRQRRKGRTSMAGIRMLVQKEMFVPHDTLALALAATVHPAMRHLFIPAADGDVSSPGAAMADALVSGAQFAVQEFLLRSLARIRGDTAQAAFLRRTMGMGMGAPAHAAQRPPVVTAAAVSAAVTALLTAALCARAAELNDAASDADAATSGDGGGGGGGGDNGDVVNAVDVFGFTLLHYLSAVGGGCVAMMQTLRSTASPTTPLAFSTAHETFGGDAAPRALLSPAAADALGFDDFHLAAMVASTTDEESPPATPLSSPSSDGTVATADDDDAAVAAGADAHAEAAEAAAVARTVARAELANAVGDDKNLLRQAREALRIAKGGTFVESVASRGTDADERIVVTVPRVAAAAVAPSRSAAADAHAIDIFADGVGASARTSNNDNGFSLLPRDSRDGNDDGCRKRVSTQSTASQSKAKPLNLMGALKEQHRKGHVWYAVAVVVSLFVVVYFFTVALPILTQTRDEGEPITEGALSTSRVVAFPGAEGFGARSRGGRGGRVIVVTTLAATGPGSLQEAVWAEGPRIVVFRVAGTIRGDIEIRHGELTIAGSTAPPPGITIVGGLYQTSRQATDVDVDTQFTPPIYVTPIFDVVIRFLRIRSASHRTTGSASSSVVSGGIFNGVTGGRKHCVELLSAHNVVLDHITVSWADRALINMGESTYVTVSYSSFEEPAPHLQPSLEAEAGVVIAASAYQSTASKSYLSFHHNLCAFAIVDSPLVRTGPVDIRNNVVYRHSTGARVDWTWTGAFIAATNAVFVGASDLLNYDDFGINIVGNFYRDATPDVTDATKAPSVPFVLPRNQQPTRVHLQDNFVDGIGVVENVWDYAAKVSPLWQTLVGAPVTTDDEAAGLLSRFATVLQHGEDHREFNFPPVSTDVPLTAYNDVLATAGALPRDYTSSRVVRETRLGVGSLGRTDPPPLDDDADDALDEALLATDSDGDGMSDVWELATGLNPRVRDHNTLMKSGYSAIEEYVQHTVKARMMAANGDPPPTTLYRLYVRGGVGGGAFAASRVVTVVADLPPAGMHFDHWFGYVDSMPSRGVDAVATLLMPAADITLSAVYAPNDARSSDP
jgi:hypothetical protein